MSILPSGVLSSSQTITFQQQPSHTWSINQDTGRIEGICDGLDAVKQAVDIILHVQRFQWQIYQPYSGTMLDDLIGEDAGYVAAEVQRRVTEALLMDDRINNVTDYTYSFQEDTLSVEFRVNTVYGVIPTSMEVNLN